MSARPERPCRGDYERCVCRQLEQEAERGWPGPVGVCGGCEEFEAAVEEYAAALERRELELEYAIDARIDEMRGR